MATQNLLLPPHYPWHIWGPGPSETTHKDAIVHCVYCHHSCVYDDLPASVHNLFWTTSVRYLNMATDGSHTKPPLFNISIIKSLYSSSLVKVWKVILWWSMNHKRLNNATILKCHVHYFIKKQAEHIGETNLIAFYFYFIFFNEIIKINNSIKKCHYNTTEW